MAKTPPSPAAPRTPIAWAECPAKKGPRGYEPDFDLAGLDGEASYSADGATCVLTIFAATPEATERLAKLEQINKDVADAKNASFCVDVKAGAFKLLNNLVEPVDPKEATK